MSVQHVSACCDRFTVSHKCRALGAANRLSASQPASQPYPYDGIREYCMHVCMYVQNTPNCYVVHTVVPNESRANLDGRPMYLPRILTPPLPHSFVRSSCVSRHSSENIGNKKCPTTSR